MHTHSFFCASAMIRTLLQRRRLSGLTKLEPLRFKAIKAAQTSVSSNDFETPEVISSYNAELPQQVTGAISVSGAIHVPGEPAIFDAAKFKLPGSVRKSYPNWHNVKSSHFGFTNALEAARIMNPTFRFDDIDVLVTRAVLVRLFEQVSSNGSNSWKWGLTLHTIHKTLVLSASHASTPGSDKTNNYGMGFERAITRLPEYLHNAPSHLRLVKYKLGPLVCAVLIELDAVYEKPGDDSNVPKMSWAEITTTPVEGSSAVKPVQNIKFPNQWFGRTPYIIIGKHKDGNFRQVAVKEGTKAFLDWEQNAGQPGLQKLVTVLRVLYARVRATKSKAAKATFEHETRHGSRDARLALFARRPGTEYEPPLPPHLIENFWKNPLPPK
ncbi:hypothetical protein QBC42DRAFT_300440 [Cladorrhinum samala]|uniref:Uncharacterized protein n=1 Tax=Cladorrhinum samala TaxID=585594 RepID=A0AAV9HDW8_9PEZI|nr:hypothetical protein QBC42DRAFT_300440 [Cladorrhinum samala]